MKGPKWNVESFRLSVSDFRLNAVRLHWRGIYGASYRDLIVWQNSVKFITRVYQVTRSFPKDELYGLTNQMRRAAVSVASNIAEGQGRLSPREFKHFLGQARGSMLELETQLEVSKNLGYVDSKTAASLEEDARVIGRMLNRLVDVIAQRAEHTTGNRKPTTGN
jgi:four helix bundle protein